MHRIYLFRTAFVILLLVLLGGPLLAKAAPIAAPIIATIDTVGDVGQYPSLVLNSSGNPVISYYASSTDFDLKVAVCGNSTCTSGNIISTVDSLGDVGEYTSLALNGSGNPVISYYDYTNGDLKIAICGNATCSSGNTVIPLDWADNVGMYTSIALNSSGNPVISYYDATNDDLNLYVCGNATCSWANDFAVVDWDGDVGRYTSLALNSSGNPVISYYDNTNGDLKLAVCGNAACDTSTITTIDASGDVGEYTSLTLNSSGNPVISYYDATNDDLKLAVCGNATCTSGKVITTVDSDVDSGEYNSLALTGSDYPLISYNRFTILSPMTSSDSLMLAECWDTTCSSKTITVIDTVQNTTLYTSLQLNSNQDPVIGYGYYDLELATRSRHDLEISKDNDSGGAGTVGQTFNWRLRLLNSGDLPVIFNNRQIILKDDLPSGPVYGVPSAGNFTSITNSSNIFCYIASHSGGERLYCEAVGGDVIIGGTNGAFEVSFDAIPDAVGTLTNPSGVCQADPENVVFEFDETNNQCNTDAVIVAGGREMDVFGNGIAIADGKTSPSILDHTDFGNADVFSGAVSHTFTITNAGDEDLSLTGSPLIELSGVNAADFDVTLLPSPLIGASASTTFEITFDPNASGLRTATVSIANDDPNENPYTFSVQGTGTDPSMLIAPLIAPTNGSVVASTDMMVIFNQAVLSDSSTGSVTNVDNYLLVEDGQNGIIDTVSCLAGPGGDDTPVAIASVDYDAARYIATLNPAVMTVGNYRLFVCGTTSIEGLSGNELNGGLSDSTSNFQLVALPTGGGTGNSSGIAALQLPATGFAPHKISLLPEQPALPAYSPMGELWLEIPALDLKKNIVGVPQSMDGWDLTWLGSDIGYLDGSAFPTTDGNTALTGHVYDANGQPGPFVNLDQLTWGSRIYIHAWGSVYTYEVRTVSFRTNPEDVNVITRHEEYDWITLITCRGYDERSDSYRWRTVVRAVLMDVSAEE